MHFCKLDIYQFAYPYPQYPNSKRCTVRSSENCDVYAQEIAAHYIISYCGAHYNNINVIVAL